MKSLTFHIHALLIAAIVMVGVSPACAFISGETSFIEICAADGSIQRIEVDANLDPFAEPVPISFEHLEDMEQCSYCFTSSSLIFDLVSVQVLALGKPYHYISVGSGTSIPPGLQSIYYHSRGPPAFS